MLKYVIELETERVKKLENYDTEEESAFMKHESIGRILYSLNALFSK
jgi:hypothetical protein